MVLNWLLTIIAATQAIFQKANFWKMCKNCVHCKINDNLLLDSGLCLKPHQWVTPSTQEKEFWFYLHLLWSYSSNKVMHVNFVAIHSVASFDATQKMWWFLTSWCQELSNGILHEWFCSDNFQSLLYLKPFLFSFKVSIFYHVAFLIQIPDYDELLKYKDELEDAQKGIELRDTRINGL